MNHQVVRGDACAPAKCIRHGLHGEALPEKLFKTSIKVGGCAEERWNTNQSRHLTDLQVEAFLEIED